MSKNLLKIIISIALLYPSSLLAEDSSPLIELEHLMQAGNWEKVDEIINTWSLEDSTRKDELKSQIKDVKSFWRDIDYCNELEKESSSSKKKIKCYKRIFQYHWEYNPKKVTFSNEFISELNYQKDDILVKIKQIHEESKKPQKEKVEAFLRAFKSCAEMEENSSTHPIELLDCYQKAQVKRKGIPRNFRFSRREKKEIGFKIKTVNNKIKEFKKKIQQIELEKYLAESQKKSEENLKKKNKKQEKGNKLRFFMDSGGVSL